MNYSELKNVFEECREELKAIGIDTAEGIPVLPMKSTRKWGECKWKREFRRTRTQIRLNVKLYDGTTDSLVPLKNTIIHELLHSVVPYAKHGYEWKRLAEKVNRHYPQYHIQRCNNFDEYSLNIRKKIEPSNLYIVKCKGCERNWTYQRYCKTIKYLSRCKCPNCGNQVYLAQIPERIQVLSVKRTQNAV